MKDYLVLKPTGFFKEVNGDDYTSTYKMLNNNVGGSIELVSFIEKFYEKGIDLWINEEGKLNDLDISIVIRNDNEFVDVLCGNIVFARSNEEGETIPLNEEDIVFIKKELQKENKYISFKNPFTGTMLSGIVPVIDL